MFFSLSLCLASHFSFLTAQFPLLTSHFALSLLTSLRYSSISSYLPFSLYISHSLSLPLSIYIYMPLSLSSYLSVSFSLFFESHFSHLTYHSLFLLSDFSLFTSHFPLLIERDWDVTSTFLRWGRHLHSLRRDGGATSTFLRDIRVPLPLY